MGLVFEWLLELGGLLACQERSNNKANAVYEQINNSNGFYYAPVSKKCRSRMNVPFRIGSPAGVEDLEKLFLKEAEDRGLIQLKGHRSVGGIRASLYNAISEAEAQALVDFMQEFYERNKDFARASETSR